MITNSFFAFKEKKEQVFEIFCINNISDFQKTFRSLLHQSTAKVAVIYGQEEH